MQQEPHATYVSTTEGPKKDFKAMQAAAAELGRVSEQLDALELRCPVAAISGLELLGLHLEGGCLTRLGTFPIFYLFKPCFTGNCRHNIGKKGGHPWCLTALCCMQVAGACGACRGAVSARVDPYPEGGP